MKDRFIKNDIEYVRNGDYFLPDFEVPQCKYEIRQFGRLRLKYIKSERKCFYSYLMITGNLNEHLHEIDVQAHEILEQFIRAAEQTAPDKATHQMEWVGHMNNAKASAMEIINGNVNKSARKQVPQILACNFKYLMILSLMLYTLPVFWHTAALFCL